MPLAITFEVLLKPNEGFLKPILANSCTEAQFGWKSGSETMSESTGKSCFRVKVIPVNQDRSQAYISIDLKQQQGRKALVRWEGLELVQQWSSSKSVLLGVIGWFILQIIKVE